MSGATLYLNEMLEEREREERRRQRKVFAAAALLALLGFAAAMYRPQPAAPPPPPPVIQIREVPVEIECMTMQAMAVEKRVIVQSLVPGRARLLPIDWPKIDVPKPEPMSRHLCVTPKKIDFARATTTADRVTVSNSGEVPFRIACIATSAERTGFLVDDSDCAGRLLGVGERCTISVAVRDAKRKPMQVLVESDRGETEKLIVE